MGISVAAFKAKLAADVKDHNIESIEQTTDIINRAQKVVNGVQIQELNAVMDILADDIFDDTQQDYYIIIDDLDTGWVHDSLRFKLVRALMETVKKFRRIPNLKIILGLRADLLETVLNQTSSAGFQTEKFEDTMLRLHWTRAELKELADKRIAYSFQDQYTNKTANFYDVFAPRVGEQDSFDFILERTLFRPRDLISYMNECLISASGTSSVSQKNIRAAEAPYSKKRLRSLADEWREVYGDLEDPIGVLRGVDVRFTSSDVTDLLVENLCINMLAGDNTSNYGTFAKECELATSVAYSYAMLRRKLLQTLYIIGAIGFKMHKGSRYEWSFRNEPLLGYDGLTIDSSFAIHPMLFRELNKRAGPAHLI